MRRSYRILGHVQPVRAQQDDIILLERINIAFDNMGGPGVEQNMNFVKIMIMLELHIDVVRPLVIIKIIKKRISRSVNPDAITLLIQ
ncbi:hypothetical protein D3C75_1076410 [compost metagenome]